MNQLRTIGLVLIILGIVAFSYQGVVTYRSREKVFQAGPVQVTAEKTHKIELPPALGSVALIAGIALLLASVSKA
jgi:hypothetical protein